MDRKITRHPWNVTSLAFPFPQQTQLIAEFYIFLSQPPKDLDSGTSTKGPDSFFESQVVQQRAFDGKRSERCLFNGTARDSSLPFIFVWGLAGITFPFCRSEVEQLVRRRQEEWALYLFTRRRSLQYHLIVPEIPLKWTWMDRILFRERRKLLLCCCATISLRML